MPPNFGSIMGKIVYFWHGTLFTFLFNAPLFHMTYLCHEGGIIHAKIRYKQRLKNSLNPVIGKLSNLSCHEGGHWPGSAVAVALGSEVFGVADLTEDFVVGCVTAQGRVQRSFAIEAGETLFVKNLERHRDHLVEDEWSENSFRVKICNYFVKSANACS